MARDLPPNSKPLECKTPGCILPFGILTVGGVTIMSYHHGEKHYNTVTYPQLLKIIDQYRASLPADLLARAST